LQIGSGPAYRVETDRLVIRCWDPKDAPLAQEAILASLDHLRRWMAWAHEEPMSVRERVETLRSFRGRFDLGEDFTYAIFSKDESKVLGATGLHARRGAGVREIGYWIRSGYHNQGLATESTAALVKVAFEIEEVRRVEIRCDPKNHASAAIPRKLGFAAEGILRADYEFLGSPRDTQIWSLVAPDYPASLARDAKIRAFGALGDTLLG
jgi:RimJ/RimL family protein N-acetyltransferase